MFVPDPQRPRVLLIGGGARLDDIVAFTRELQDRGDARSKPLVLIELNAPNLFRPRPSTILVPGMPEGTIACVPLLDEWGIASRLASVDGYPGCYEGGVVELAAAWLDSLDRQALDETQMLVWGSAAVIDAAAAVARRFDVPCRSGADPQPR